MIICLGPSASSPSHHHFDNFQNELKTKVRKKQKRLKRENSRMRISSLESSDLRCSNSRKYSTSSNVLVVPLKEKCNQSSSSAKNVLVENLNCLNANENMDEKIFNDNEDDDDNDDDYDNDKVKKVDSSYRLSSHFLLPPLASLKNRISTIFQRLSLTTGNESKETPSENHNEVSFLKPNNTAELTKFFETRSRRNEFDAARNELLTLKCFLREGCENDENQEKANLEK